MRQARQDRQPLVAAGPVAWSPRRVLAVDPGIASFRVLRLVAASRTHVDNNDVTVMQDFRDALYFPVKQFLSGGNPYDPGSMFQNWPVGQEFDLYLPAHLWVHLPFALLPYRPRAFTMAWWTSCCCSPSRDSPSNSPQFDGAGPAGCSSAPPWFSARWARPRSI